MSHLFEELAKNQTIIRPGEAGEIVDPTIDIQNGDGVYGYRPKGYGRPEQLSSITEEAGGFIFMPAETPDSFIDGLMEVAGLGSNERRKSNQFGIQVLDAPVGMEKELGYLRKIVIADRFALRFLYGVIDEGQYNNFPEQPCDAAGAVKAFMESEREKYGTFFGNPKLARKFGGDGNFAEEALGFGFAIENYYNHVISVWSRGWLCTK